MQFVKKIFGYQADPSLKFEFTNFRSEANLYQMEGEKRLPKYIFY